MRGERMSKMRIYEYAREKNVSSKEVIDELLKMEIEVASHMSSINVEEQAKLDEVFNPQPKKEDSKKKIKQTTKNKKVQGKAQKETVKKEKKQQHKKTQTTSKKDKK